MTNNKSSFDSALQYIKFFCSSSLEPLTESFKIIQNFNTKTEETEKNSPD